MFSNILKEAFVDLGLDETDYLTYQFLLETKNPNVKAISENLKINRKKVYEILQNLKNLNLIQKENDFSRKFIVEPPTQILALLKARNAKSKHLEDTLEKMIPSLLEDFHKNNKTSKVRFFETKESFMQVLHELVFESGGEIWCLGSPKILDFAPEYMSWYIQNRKRNNVISNSIMFEDQLLRKRDHKADLRPIKWIPAKFNGSAAVLIYGNKIAIWNTVLPKIIVIEDQIIHETFKVIWQLLWEGLDT